MKLIDNWHHVLRKAWSVRLIILSAIFSVIETFMSLADSASDPAFVIMPLTGLHVPRGMFAILSAVVAVFALVVRVIAQQEMVPDADQHE